MASNDPAWTERYYGRRSVGLCTNCGRREATRGVRCDDCAERRSLRRHFWGQGGTDAYTPPATLEAIGSAMGITRERARQIQAQALNRFCERMVRLGWSHEDALLGLATLGVQSMERAAAPREVVRGKWYTAGRSA